ncbi:MAG TPA: sulfurtransferase, partial [Mycobacteriales bacterium]|nr:sulfurtransferase [Mycobacteriales bacterium]
MTPLITVAELSDLLANGPVRVLDARWRLLGPPARADHVTARIPGAAFVDVDGDLAAPPGRRGRHPLPDAGDFERAMRRAGVCADVPVVVYDDADGSTAARAWWLLRHHGHGSVQVLDGGWAAWTAAGQPVESGEPVPPPEGDFTAQPGRMPVVDVDEVLDLARDGVLLDARAGERYRGEVEPVDPVAGHVPGARSAPTADNVGADGRFRSPEEIGDRFTELGVDGTRPV